MSDKFRRYRSIAIIAVVGVAVAVWLARFSHEMSVDSCFDGGGVYLEEIEKCSHSQDEVDRYRRR